MLPSIQHPIIRANVDELLDAGQLYVHMKSLRWWRIRRNGATKRWKKDALRIAIPFKYGMYGYGKITESDFDRAENGLLNPDHIRHCDDVPAALRA